MREAKKRTTRTVKVLVELEVTRLDGKPILDEEVVWLVQSLLLPSEAVKLKGVRAMEEGQC